MKVGEVVLELNILNNTDAQLKKFGKSADTAASKIGKSFATKFGKALAAGVTALGFAKLIEEGLNAASASNRLAVTMANATGASKENIEAIKALTNRYEELGVVSATAQQAGMQELATYVSKTKSIEKMLPVLNDMVAQQYGYAATAEQAVTISTMLGKVLQGQTGALSRYGYAFDEAQEAILKYGTEEQRVATLAEVVSQSVGGMNRALGATPEGAIVQLKNNFGRLKEELGALLINVLYPFVKILNVIISKFVSLAQVATGAIKKIFGIEDSGLVGSIQNSGAQAVSALEDQADEMEKVQEKMGLASFDKLNTIGSNKQTSTAGAGTDFTAGTEFINATNTATLATEKLTQLADKLKEKFLEVFKTDAFQAFVKFGETAAERLKITFEKIKTTAAEIAPSIKNNLVKSFENLSPIWTDFWNAGTNALNTYGPALSENIDSLFRTVATSVSDIWLDLTKRIGEIWDNHGKVILEQLWKAVGEGVNWVIKHADDVWKKIKDLWDNHLSTLFSTVGDTLAILVEDILKLWNNVLGPFIRKAEEWVTAGFFEILGVAVDVIDQLVKTFRSIIEFLEGVFTGDWDKAWKGLMGIGENFMGAFEALFSGGFDLIGKAAESLGRFIVDNFEPLVNFFGNLFSNIYDAIRSPIDWISDKISSLFGWIGDARRALSDFGNSVSGFLNNPWGSISNAWNSMTSWLPHFAQGGFVDQPTLAVVGEGGQGEYIVPQNDMKSLIGEVIKQYGGTGSQASSQPIEIVLQLDGQTITRTIVNNINRMNKTTGTNVIKSYGR